MFLAVELIEILGIAVTGHIVFSLVGIAMVPAGIVLVVFWIRGYRCCVCGDRLVKAEEVLPVIQFPCHRCRIVWDLGEPDASE
jgi:hypothetical protein